MPCAGRRIRRTKFTAGGRALVRGDVVADDHAGFHHEAHLLHFVHVGERISCKRDDICKLAVQRRNSACGSIDVGRLQGLHWR